MSARSLAQHVQACFMRIGFFVHPLRTKSVIHVSHRHHARRYGNRIAPQTVGITAAVPAFMMGLGNINAHIQKGIVRVLLANLPQRLRSIHRMELHFFKLFRCQSPRFKQDGVANGDFTYIVKRAGVIDIFHKGVIYFTIPASPLHFGRQHR